MLRTLVDELSVGKPAQVGMPVTTQGWQAVSIISNALTTALLWFSHFASAVLQVRSIALVA